MSDTIFGLLILVIGTLGIIAYGVIMLKAASEIHKAQNEYYGWLKNGGGQIKNIAEYYPVKDNQ